jgi:hypothetical protein
LIIAYYKTGGDEAIMPFNKRQFIVLAAVSLIVLCSCGHPEFDSSEMQEHIK